MPRLLALALALIVVVGVLLWRMPASFVLARLPQVLDTHLRIHSASGTIWDGQAEFSSPWLPATHSLAWRCRPTSLKQMSCGLSGILQGELRLEREGFSGGIVHGHKLQAAQPLQVVLGGRPTASLDRLELMVEELTYASDRLQVKGQAQARALRLDTAVAGRTVSLAAIRELSADCNPAGAVTLCAIRSRDTEGQVSGELRLGPQRVGGSVEINLPGISAQRLNF